MVERVLGAELWVDDPILIGIVDYYPSFDTFLGFIGFLGSLMDVNSYDLDFSIVLVVFFVNFSMFDDL